MKTLPRWGGVSGDHGGCGGGIIAGVLAGHGNESIGSEDAARNLFNLAMQSEGDRLKGTRLGRFKVDGLLGRSATVYKKSLEGL